MPFYSSNEKLKRKRIAKESNKQINIGSGSGEETIQPTETFTYREPKLFFNLPFTVRFLNNIQVSDYPRRFRSVNPILLLELYSVSIVQNGSQVSLDEENSNYNIYPNKSFQQMVDDGDISVKWFMDGIEVVGETDASLALDKNNGDQGKSVYAEVTNNIDSSVVTSNTITVQEFTGFIDNFDNNTIDTNIWTIFGDVYGSVSINNSNECIISNTSGGSDDVIGIATQQKFAVGTQIKARVKNTSGRHSAIIGFGDTTYIPYPHARSGIGCTWYSNADILTSFTSYEDENGTTGYGSSITQNLTSYQEITLQRESSSIVKIYRNGTLEQTFDNVVFANNYSFYFSANGYTKPNTIEIDWVEITEI